MDTPFIYDQYVTGKNFIGRKAESGTIRNMMERFENICIYEPPKSGKMSLVQQTMFNMRLSGKPFVSTVLTLFNIRSLHSFLIKFGTAILRQFATTPAEYGELVAAALPDTHFVFDPERFSSDDEVVSLNWDADSNDIVQMMRLPYTVSKLKQTPLYVLIEEFQNLMMLEEKDYELVFSSLKAAMSEAGECNVSFVLTGSKVNAMKYIFEERKYFYRMVSHLPLQQIDSREIAEYAVRGFLVSGKVVERDLMLGAASLFRCNMWYINHFTAICDALSKGYINEGIFLEALKTLISIHEPKFMSIADDLTDHQMNMMRAILDGVKKFSSTEVIEKYGFNSSANVRRIKDALKKKEIITFDDKDEPVILDPLFEYWLTKHYFER